MDADRKQRYRENLAREGGRRISIQLLPRDPVDQWTELADRHGGDKPALLYLLGLARGQQGVTDDVAIAYLVQRLRASPGASGTHGGPKSTVRPRTASSVKRAGKSH